MEIPTVDTSIFLKDRASQDPEIISLCKNVMLPTLDLFIFLVPLSSLDLTHSLFSGIDTPLQAAQILVDTGILIVRDPRVDGKDNDVFLDMVEDYFNQEYELKMKDARPEFGYQVGVTPGLQHPFPFQA